MKRIRTEPFTTLSPYLKAVVRPGAEFHLAALIIRGEPGNVYLASAFEYAGRYV